jgi:hypothetical protein
MARVTSFHLGKVTEEELFDRLYRMAIYSGMHLNEIHHKSPPRLRGGGWGWGSCISLNQEPLYRP